MALPDFLVAGVPKAGTTALHAALSRHPGLYLSPVKEPKFFLTDGPPPTKGGPGDALTYREHIWQRDRYEALFDAAAAGTLRGESTPLYLYDPAAIRSSARTPTGPTCGRPAWSRSATSSAPAPKRSSGSRPAGRPSGTTRGSASTASSSRTRSPCSRPSRRWCSGTGC